MVKTHPSVYAERIKQCRKHLNMTQSSFAKLCGCTPQSIWNIEHEIRRPGLSIALKIKQATGFDITADEDFESFESIDSVETAFNHVIDALNELRKAIYTSGILSREAQGVEE